VKKRSTLPDRLSALRTAMEAARGRIDPEVEERVDAILTRLRIRSRTVRGHSITTVAPGTMARSDGANASEMARSSDMTEGRRRARSWPSGLSTIAPRPNSPSRT